MGTTNHWELFLDREADDRPGEDVAVDVGGKHERTVTEIVVELYI